jgi:hypothetical protein
MLTVDGLKMQICGDATNQFAVFLSGKSNSIRFIRENGFDQISRKVLLSVIINQQEGCV